MWITKPTKPEDLYKFFTYGMPLKPTRVTYPRAYLRKGWNVYVSIRHYVTAEVATVEFYSLASAYYPDWKASVYKHVNTETK